MFQWHTSSFNHSTICMYWHLHKEKSNKVLKNNFKSPKLLSKVWQTIKGYLLVVKYQSRPKCYRKSSTFLAVLSLRFFNSKVQKHAWVLLWNHSTSSLGTQHRRDRDLRYISVITMKTVSKYDQYSDSSSYLWSIQPHTFSFEELTVLALNFCFPLFSQIPSVCLGFFGCWFLLLFPIY